MDRRYRLSAVAAISAAVSAALIAASPAHATPYASGITQTAPGQYSFYLNEAADKVVVKFSNGTSQTISAPAAGQYNFSLPGGATSFTRIDAVKSAAAGWTRVGTDSSATNFEIPRGVGVNTNPGSGGSFNPWFGTIYVANGRNLPTAAGRLVTAGVYVLNPDQTWKYPEVVDGFDVARTGGVGWTGSGGVSPFRVQVGPDNQVYVTDWSDASGGLWALDPAITTNTQVLDTPSRDADGAGPTHGSISDVMIRGTGANRVIYTEDEDGFYAPDATAAAHAGSILKYNIGTTPTFTGQPSAIVWDNDPAPGPAGSKNINFFNSLDQAKDGSIWWSQNRAGATGEAFASLMQVDPATNAVVWNSLSLSPTGDSAGDPFRTTQGIAVDPVTGNIAAALARNDAGGRGIILIFNPTTKTIVNQLYFDPGAATGSTTNCDIVFDAAGNLYVTNRSAEYLRVYSPGGATRAITTGDGQFVVRPAAIPGDADDDGDVDRADLNILIASFNNPPPVINASTGDFNGDGRISSDDFALFGLNAAIYPALTIGGSPIPEPATAIAACGLGAAALLRRRRQS